MCYFIGFKLINSLSIIVEQKGKRRKKRKQKRDRKKKNERSILARNWEKQKEGIWFDWLRIRFYNYISVLLFFSLSLLLLLLLLCNSWEGAIYRALSVRFQLPWLRRKILLIIGLGCCGIFLNGGMVSDSCCYSSFIIVLPLFP